MKLAALDLCAIRKGRPSVESLYEAVELAEHLDQLGFSRIWLSEHHTRDVAHGSPELLVPMLAGRTERIRVGPAGILLLFYSPMKVAKNFRLLQAFFEHRIDLGIAGGGGTSPEETALLDGVPIAFERYVEKVEHLVRYLTEDTPPPFHVAPPLVWVLGTNGTTSPDLAARLGTAFSQSLFMTRANGDPSLVARYRDQFRPSVFADAPVCNVAVAGSCTESAADAAEVKAYYGGHPGIRAPVVGSPAECRERLEEIADRFGVDEVVFVDVSQTHEARLRSFQLLASVMGLPRLDSEDADQQDRGASS